MGIGKWAVKVHGARKRRKYIKAHIAVDPTSQEIIADEIAESSSEALLKMFFKSKRVFGDRLKGNFLMEPSKWPK